MTSQSFQIQDPVPEAREGGLGAPSLTGQARTIASSRAAWGLCAIAMIAVVVLARRYSRLMDGNISDDAMTSMQYAKNLVLGNGLVFNIGERVEGYTNFLWVIAMAPLYALSQAFALPFVPLVNHLNVAIAAVVTGLVYWIGSQLWGKWHLATWVAVFLLVADNAYTTWAVLGLEVHFLAMWMLAALAFVRSNLRHRAALAGVALLAAHLTRPDAALFCACVVGNELFESWLAWRRGDRTGATRIFRGASIATAVWVIPYAAYFAWRYSYYGWLLPNTFYLKLGGSIDGWARGLAYTVEFLTVRAWVPALGIVAAFGVRDKTVRALVVYLALHVIYVIYAGGDFMPGHRFFVPELPQFALLVGATLSLLWRAVNRRPIRLWLSANGAEPAKISGFALAVAMGGLALFGARLREQGPLNSTIASWGNDHGRQRTLMAWLKERKPPGATFATGLIGHTGFLSDIYVIDTCGIIDTVVSHMTVKDFGHGLPGHEKIASVDYVLAKKPTYVGIYVLPTDLWRRGYYLDADVPPDTVDGIWVRDTLPERGRFLESTRIDFDHGELSGWSIVGNAFEQSPTLTKGEGQGDIAGASGGFLNSYHRTLHNAATGSLRSPPFDLVGDELVFRLAGGRDANRLRVALWVDDKIVHSTTGRQMDTMIRRSWNIRPYRGKKAELQIVDESVEPWGYIAVDDVVQWEESAKR